MSYTAWFCIYIVIYTHTHTADSLNSSSLDVVERAQFILCLDQGHPSTSSLPPHSLFSDIHSTVLVNRCLHGGGSEFSSGNRWFDSGIQVCSYCVVSDMEQGFFSLGDLFVVVFISILQKFTAGENLHSYLCHAFTLHWTLSRQLRCPQVTFLEDHEIAKHIKTLVKIFQVYRKPKMPEQLKQPKELSKQKLGAWSNNMEVVCARHKTKVVHH